MSTAVETEKPKRSAFKTAESLFDAGTQDAKRLVERMSGVLPKTMDPLRMASLARTAFYGDWKLRNSTFESMAAAIMSAAQMGLEIGVDGQGWIVAYKSGKLTKKYNVDVYEAQFVPGWKGLVSLLDNTLAHVKTHAVYEGDEFDWQDGTKPYLHHKPRGEKDGKILYFYCLGFKANWVEHPYIDVRTPEQIRNHLSQYNKVGNEHYATKNANNFEQYGRKVPLMQVLKYLPKSPRLRIALDVAGVTDTGSSYTVDADGVVKISEQESEPENKGLRAHMESQQESNEPEVESEEPEVEQSRYESMAEMINAATSEANCRSLSKMVKTDAGLSEAEKDQLSKLAAARAKILLKPEEPLAFDVWMKKISESKAEDSQSLAHGIETDSQLSAPEKKSLVDLLTKTFASDLE